MSAHLRLFQEYGPERQELSITSGAPLGAATVHGPDVQGLPGFLRRNGCLGVGDRFCVPLRRTCAAEDVDRVLVAPMARSVTGDPCWFVIEADLGNTKVQVAMTTREQRELLRQCDVVAIPDPGDLVLSNGQVIRAKYLERPYRAIPLEWADGTGGVDPDGETVFQAVDSAPYSAILDSPHSYYVVLPSAVRACFSSGWARASHTAIVGGAELTSEFPVQTAFSGRLEPRTAAVDETISVALAMREGELVKITPLDSQPRAASRRRLFAFRHTVLRVTGATTMDMEKPIVRIEPGVLDILGVGSGDRVVVETLSRTTRRLESVPVRALEERDQKVARLNGVVDVLDVTGSVDLPAIAMDLSMRNRLGVRRGDAVYVRPEFTSHFLTEFTTASYALLAAALGAFIANSFVLASGLIGVYLALSALTMWRKFR